MKTSTIRLISVLLAILPFAATARQNIDKAFNAIIDCPDAEIVESHNMERDPDTGAKIGQSDTYRFTLSGNKMSLIKNVLQAFRADNEMAYSMSSGRTESSDPDIILAVGDGRKNNVVVSSPGCDYIYACFLAPKEEDPDGNYRYAYAINYKQEEGKIVGKIVITYATTMKYRQEHLSATSLSQLTDLGTWGDLELLQNLKTFNGSEEINNRVSWFNQFMKYIQGMTGGNQYALRSLAGKIFEHSQRIEYYKGVTAQDKFAAREILKTLMEDPKIHDSIVEQLLKSSIENLK